ncbi:hypothetical protein [Methylobacterium nodulans]|uniref:Uncharacterized protein n=1 Tax=Methylobacterium nodulans (strain LMG 21967 / CNCM I-2342 / ORS 2060) TaxID=460265 RepID=B8IEZ2_METNO|nr:hypothetical protein [Methylobacterium nodulans]ACL55703.1 conserved hypothetical protein [Methylobacterium nodulans ORS 2060]
MALEIDGLAILCAIAEAPQAFPAIRQDVGKVAQSLVTKQLKAKDLTLDALRQLQAALGPQPLALVVESLSDAEVRTLVTRLDRTNAALKAATPVEHRRRLLALAAGAEPETTPATAPTAKPAGARSRRKAAPEPSPAGPPTGRALDSAAMAAVPPRRRRPA